MFRIRGVVGIYFLRTTRSSAEEEIDVLPVVAFAGDFLMSNEQGIVTSTRYQPQERQHTWLNSTQDAYHLKTVRDAHPRAPPAAWNQNAIINAPALTPIEVSTRLQKTQSAHADN